MEAAGGDINNEGQYVFSSSPTLPREKTPDILVKFKATSYDQPCILSKTFYISSGNTLVEVRRKIHKTFAPCFEKGFIFLHRNTEVLRSRERIIRVFDILPKPPRRDLNPAFKFPDIQYKKISYEKGRRRLWSVCAGVIFLFEDSGLNQWPPGDLQTALSGTFTDAFSYVPFAVTSLCGTDTDTPVDKLNYAASKGNLSELRDVLQGLPKETDPRLLKDFRKTTPLHYAAQSGHLDACEMLIGHLGRDLIYMKDTNVRTPLHCAITFNKLDVVVYLLQLSPDLDCLDVHGLSCRRMLLTMKNKFTEMILSRLDPGLLDETLVLHFACYTIQMKMVELAKTYCRYVLPFESSFYRPPLHLAAEKGYEEIVKLLLEETSVKQSNQKTQDDDSVPNEKCFTHHDPQDKDPDGYLPFHYACQHGHAAIVSLLYFENMENADFVKGIHLAVSWKRYNILDVLLSLRDNFQIRSATKEMLIKETELNFQNLAIHCLPCLKNEKHLLNRFLQQAAYHGEIDVLTWLLDQGVEVDLGDFMGRTALHYAVHSNHNEIVKVLLKSGANPHVCDWRKSTPLHDACSLGNLGTVRILLKCNNIHSGVQDSRGRTPIMRAAYNKNNKLMFYLIKNHLKRMNPNAVDVNKHSLLHYIPLLKGKTVEALIKRLASLKESAPVVVRPPKHVSEVNLYDIWTDWSHVHRDVECPEMRRPKKTLVTATQNRCTRCGKLWTEIGGRRRWNHICRVLKEDGKLHMDRVSREENAVICQTISRPFQTFATNQPEDISLLKLLILHNRPDLIPKIAANLPEVFEKEVNHAAVLAAKVWSLNSLVWLNNLKTFTNDQLNSLLVAALINNTSDRYEDAKQLGVVKQLLEMGAMPNYIPQDLEVYYGFDFTTRERDLLFFTSLELVALKESEDIINLLLHHNTSTLTCFAIHFAVWKGNTAITSTLLAHRENELLSGDNIHGITGLGEYRRICEQGIFQAAVCNLYKIQDVLSVLTSISPELLQSTSLLTQNMVTEIRPHILRSSPLNRFVFSLLDDAPFNVLPLTYLVESVSKSSRRTELEDCVCALIDNNVHLGDVRITKTSSVHCVCQVFVAAVRKRLWKVVDRLLVRGGSVLCQCLLSQTHPCHKYVYFQYKKEPLPFMLSFWQTFLKTAPLETEKMFFQLAKDVNEGLDLQDIKHVMGKCKSDETEIMISDILCHITWLHIKRSPSKVQHLVAGKVVHIFPKLFPRYISIIRAGTISWLLAVTRCEIERIFVSNKHLTTRKALEILQNSTREARLMVSLSKLTPSELRYMQTNETSLLQFAALRGDLDLAKSCLSALNPLAVDCSGKDELAPLTIAAAVGDVKMMELLLKHGHVVQEQTLSAVCRGKEIVALLSWRFSVPRTQTMTLHVLKKLQNSSSDKFWLDHQNKGTVLKLAISKEHWEITEYILKCEEQHSSLATYPRTLMVKLFTKAPAVLCRQVLTVYKADVLAIMEDVGGEILTNMSRMRNDNTVDLLLKLLFEDTAKSVMCKQLAKHLTYCDSHKGTTLHYLCQKGKSETVFFISKKLGRTKHKSVESILNMKDSSGATPLWYAMAGQHWDIAEQVLLNGGGLPSLRSVPDWKSKRKFSITRVQDRASGLGRGGVRTAAWIRNASFETGHVISPDSKTFDIYRHDPPLVKPREQSQQTVICPTQTKYTKQQDRARRDVLYLLSLWQFAQVTSSTMVHAAAAHGDVGLVQSLLTLPLYQPVRDLSNIQSPLSFAVTNCQILTAELCIERGLVSATDTYLLDTFAVSLAEACGFTNVTSGVAVQVKKHKFSEEITTDLKHLYNEMTKPSKCMNKTMFNSKASELKESDLEHLTRLVLRQNTGSVPDSLLFVFALLGKSWLGKVFQQLIGDRTVRAEMYSRKITSHLTVLDFVFILAKQNVGKENKADMMQRTELLKLISADTDLSLNPDILDIAVQKNLYSMLNVVAQDCLKKGIPIKTITHWESYLLNVGKLGLDENVKTLIQWMDKSSTSMDSAAQLQVPSLLETLLSVSCLHAHTGLIEYLLQHGVSVSSVVNNIPSTRKPRGAIDCAVLSGKWEVVDICLKAFGEKWEIPSTNCLHIAAAVCRPDLLEKLLKSKRYSRFSTKSFSEELLLIAAKQGNEANCIHLLSNKVADVLKTDKTDSTVLHYACVYNMKQVAENIVKSTKDALKMTDSEGMTPINIARHMGNTDIALLMALKEDIDLQSKKHTDLNHVGWLKRVLRSNVQQQRSDELIMPKDITILEDFRKMRPKYCRSLESRCFQRDANTLDLPHALAMNDDHGAHAMLEVAQETVIQVMRESYSHYPLLHLCAIMGCQRSLRLLLQLIKKYTNDSITTWTRKTCQRGQVPIAYAIENKQTECVKILFAEDACLDWVNRVNGETLLHHVAKTGSEEISHLISPKATEVQMCVRDKNDCTAAAVCVALGHHAVVDDLLRGIELDSAQHAHHVQTDFSCVDCLLDRCIGWSRKYCHGTHGSTRMPYRDVIKREHFTQGYTGDGTGNLYHPLVSLLTWSMVSTTSDVLDAGLTVMKYDTNTPAGQLFVLLNMCKTKDVDILIYKALSCRFDAAACYLFKQNVETLVPVIDQLCLTAVACHNKTFFNCIVNEADVVKKSTTPSALDVAFGFGNFEAVRYIEETNGDIQTDHVKLLTELADILPLSVRWRLGLSQPGGDEWNNSIISQTKMITEILPELPIASEAQVVALVVGQTHRISEPDALLCMKPDNHFRQILESLPITKETFLPPTFLEKAIKVDMKNFESAGVKFDIRGIWLYSLILSKLIMGRYHLEIDLDSAQWKSVNTIVISCVPDGSSEVPEMKVFGSELHDKVRLRRMHASEVEAGSVIVDTAEIPLALCREGSMKTLIQETTVPELESLIQEKLTLQNVVIEVDWGSIDSAKDRQCRHHIFLALTGDLGGNRLAGLESMILQSGYLLDGISELAGLATAKRAVSLIATIKTIVVRYVDVFPTNKRIILSSSDSKIFWYFTLKDLALHYKSSLFSIYRSLKGYHSACYSIANCVVAVKDKHFGNLDKNNAQSKHKLSGNVWHPVEMHIDVRSFEEAGILESIDVFFQNSVAQTMIKIGSAYKYMLRLKMDVEKIKVLATGSKEKSGLSYKERTLTIALKISRPLDGAWQIEELDFYKTFTDMEVKQIKEMYSCDKLTEMVKNTEVTFEKSFGIPLDISLNSNEWLEDVMRTDNRQMSHPLDLLTTYVETFADHTLASYEDALMQELTTANCWLLQKIKLPCGFWCAVNDSELNDAPKSSTFLVQRSSVSFETLTQEHVKKLDTNSVIGLWYLKSVDQVTKNDKLQLLSLKDMLFYIPDSRFGSRFISGLKSKIEIQSRHLVIDERLKHSLHLSFDDITNDISRIMYCKNPAIQKAAKSFAFHVKPLTNIRIKEGYMLYTIWTLASKFGINVWFDLNGFEQKSLEVVAYVVWMTLSDIANMETSLDKQVQESLLNAVRKLGTVSVGFHSDASDTNKEMGRVDGSSFSEMADITFVTERDLHISFRPAILVSDLPLQPITETLRSALCKSYQVLAPQRIMQTLSQVLDTNLSYDSITVPKFYHQKNNIEILHAVSTLLNNFDVALQHVNNHDNARMRLQSELRSVVFTEYTPPVSVATFTNGVLECSLFKGGNTVSIEELQTDIIAALEYQPVSPEGPRFRSKPSSLELADGPDSESVLTVTCQGTGRCNRQMIQRLKRAKGTSNVAIDNATEQLFYHVELGQTGNIETDLDIGADINRRGEHGMTPFLRSCQLRNYVVQKVLLRRGASVNKADKLRHTPLHFEAAYGDVESLTLLLTHKAKVNVRDKNGRTPLHYAVKNSHFKASDLLVFCGADGTIKDKNMQSPASHCRQPRLRRLMMESQLTVMGIKNGYIQIEHVTLEADRSYDLPRVGLSLRTPRVMGGEGVSMVWRRVQPEYSRPELLPADRELLMSDVFEYRLSGSDLADQLTLKIPVYSKPDRFEEVYMKTDRDDYLGKLLDIREEQDRYVCYVKIKLSSMKSFVLVTLPKLEIFHVTSSGGTYTSSVAQVEILVKPGTFDLPGDLTLEIIPKPTIEEEEFDKVLSLSHFFNISHADGDQPQKEVIMAIPLPHDYFGDGELFVMMRHEVDYYQHEESLWEILDKNPPIQNGMVNVNVPHFSECNLLEYREAMEDIPLSETEKEKLEKQKEVEVIRLNTKLLAKAKRQECSVVFIGMLKPLPDSRCEAVIECARNNHLGKRLKYWKNEGYKDQNPSFTSDFVTFPKQEFKLDISGNAKKVNSLVTTLQYHPKRQNVLKVPIFLVDQQKDKVGWVNIAEKQEKLEKDFEMQPDYNSLAKILLHLFPFDRSGSTKTTESITEEEKAFEGFTDETLLKELAHDLDFEWQRVARLLGFSDRSLQTLADRPEEKAEDQRYRLLQSWRDSRLHRRDHGVPELVIALQKGGRKDLVQKVIKTLEEWLSGKKERRDHFLTWLKTALTGAISTNEALLKPMSDEFITNLVQKTGVILDLASELDVSKPELDNIKIDPLAKTPESKMIRVFTTSRDKHTSDDKAFETTVEALTRFSLDEPRNWMLQTARQWTNSIEKTDDPFVHHISDYLNTVEPLYMPLVTDEQIASTD